MLRLMLWDSRHAASSQRRIHGQASAGAAWSCNGASAHDAAATDTTTSTDADSTLAGKW